MNRMHLLAAVAAAVILSGCAGRVAEKPIGLANPAAMYCVDKGGKLDMVTEDGQRVTYCVLSDGRRVEEWQYFRENHPQLDETDTL
ncbi:DUF333 domain-containing protein [Photobacterium sp. 1_MG-2023]|uniref:putative hemolysin n=1 Tax=Photobacterium sp. 1_MG-2023 TaxID=3062646 RepID=UPI0026E3B116|nr:DUF333 domain-containing protein [Photobacterium sp. 1_MG-2023]MDO6706518.1 DUF333 domain-containing protein [Photobacterium sp. 1_MG-2023]